MQEVRHDPLEIAALARHLLPAVVERSRLGKPRADATSDIIVEHHHVDAFDLLATKAGRELSTHVLSPKASSVSTFTLLSLDALNYVHRSQ